MAPKTIRMRAIRKCWHGKRYYNVGDVVDVQEDDFKDVPRHFVPLESFTEAAVKAAEAEDRKSRAVKVKAARAPKE